MTRTLPLQPATSVRTIAVRGGPVSAEMSWLNDQLVARAGPLAPAAQAFLSSWLSDNQHTFRGGSEGLVSLCRCLMRFLEREEVSEDEERRFVEGAGSLLALILIDHLKQGAHVARDQVHRVRLGRYGFFDPFSAIDRALDAPDPRAELARQVQLAEAEGSGEGPLARVVASLVSALRRERQDLEVVDHFDGTLSLRMSESGETLQVDLRRAVETTRDQDLRAVHTVTQRMLSMLPGAPEAALDLDEVRTRLVPRIVRRDALADLTSSGHCLLASAPLTRELSTALLLEYDGRARYVRDQELAGWGMPIGVALEQARENLAQRSQAARIVRMDTEHGPLYVARTGDGRDSARVLLPRLYEELRARVGEPIALGLPHRDTFMFCSAENRALVASLAARVREDARRAPHRLSEELFVLRRTGLIELAHA